MESRTPKQVIDQAISDNKASEYLLYFLAFLFATVGLGILSFGVYRENTISSIAGVVASSFFWPAMSSARRTRKECIAIRLLEDPLSRADTASEAADTIRQVVEYVLKDNRKDG